jgi:hypothetical protein
MRWRVGDGEIGLQHVAGINYLDQCCDDDWLKEKRVGLLSR